jgi:hypothetical protein
MRTSNIIISFNLACACSLSGSLNADDVLLSDGARVTGSVRSILESGVIELTSELSPLPLCLRIDTVQKVQFSPNDTLPPPPPTLLELTNGDRIHVTLETLDDRILTVISPDAGRLQIPRESLKCIQLGLLQKQAIYSGPRNLDEWKTSNGQPRNWTFDRHSLIANGPAMASTLLALPQQFILRFSLKWQPRQIPNFQIFFADPLKTKGDFCNRYYLQYGGAGLEIKREASTGKRYNSLMQLNRNPDQYPDHQLRVELRVNRKDARMQLLLNGKSEGEFADPFPTPPDGSGLTLVSNAPSGTPQEISNIEVLKLDDSRSRHRAEDRGNPKIDSLISLEDDRWGGHLIGIRNTQGRQLFLFKNDFKNDTSEIPVADLSTVFFATAEPKIHSPAIPLFSLRLRGEGLLRVSSCLLRDNSMAIIHPLLGPLNILRHGVVSIERSQATPQTVPDP